MHIGAVYPQIELRGDPAAVRAIGTGVEELGYDHLVVYDHVLGATHDHEPKLWGPYTKKDPFHDPFVMLGYLAAVTSRIGLMTGVLILPQRQTVLVARQAADLDLLSGERLRLGVGTGWNYVEYDALGQDFSTRGKRIDEQIPYLRRLWSEPLVSFEGQFDRVDRGHVHPQPTRQIPIWVGGFSEPAFRRRAGRRRLHLRRRHRRLHRGARAGPAAPARRPACPGTASAPSSRRCRRSRPTTWPGRSRSGRRRRHARLGRVDAARTRHRRRPPRCFAKARQLC